MTNYVRLLTLLVGSAALACAADPSFTGTWKLDLSKSKLSGQTFSIEKKASGGYHFDSQGFAYDFNTDGKEYPAPDGSTASWRMIDASTWEVTNRAGGKVTSTFTLSQKEPNMTVVMKVAKPDGTTVAQTSVNPRVSGGPGMTGKWKTGDTTGAATTMVITADASHITIAYPEFKQTCTGAFDGKDNVQKIADADSKATQAFEKSGASIKITTKIGGKPFYTDILTLSADGKTLTDAGKPVAVNEPSTGVYQRQ